ncbi:sec7 and TBC domain-containing protein [Cryptosporidium canis]|uniref:Sec7 and TBC domain-containing protein n=1 Tax=Cryptosporidium canis TaxID=195482 RepID=A0A9D5DQU4_9CRYT|nr:sec7 and TBC domain-containing protein [Cryptosporidium canis]
MAPSKPSISKAEAENPKGSEEAPSQSQVESRAPELEAACPDSPENPNPGYSHSLEPDACQNPIRFFKTVSALELEQPRFASNSSSVSLPLKRISQEDWSGSGVNGSSEDNKLVIPSLSTRKIRQILLASRRSNSGHQVHDNAGMVLRQHGRYSQTPSVRSVDSVSGTFASVQSCGPLIEGGGKSVQFDQDYSNLTLDECNSCVSSLDSRHPKSHQKSGSLASSSAGGHPPGRQTRGLDMCYSQQYISQGQCHMDILKEEIHLMEQLEQGVLLFNNSPEEGISYMIEHELVEDDPLYIANFILHTDFLDKRKVGELLGGHSNLSLSILNNYVHLFNTSSLEPDVALRYFLSRFFLPGESQMVYRILERFSTRSIPSATPWSCSTHPFTTPTCGLKCPSRSSSPCASTPTFPLQILSSRPCTTGLQRMSSSRSCRHRRRSTEDCPETQRCCGLSRSPRSAPPFCKREPFSGDSARRTAPTRSSPGSPRTRDSSAGRKSGASPATCLTPGTLSTTCRLTSRSWSATTRSASPSPEKAQPAAAVEARIEAQASAKRTRPALRATAAYLPTTPESPTKFAEPLGWTSPIFPASSWTTLWTSTLESRAKSIWTGSPARS